MENGLLDGGRSVEAEGVTIQLPKGWKRKQDLTISLHVTTSAESLYPNLKVAIVKLPKSKTMMDSVTASKAAWAKIWTNEDERAATVNGSPAYRLVQLQDLGVTKCKQVKYFIAGRDKVFIVTGQSEPKEFDEQLPLFEAMVHSLEIAR